MKNILYIFILLKFFAFISCEGSIQEIKTKQYSGKVYTEKPNEKDISYTPDNKEIKLFEKQLDSNLNQLFANTNDSIPNGTKEKVLSEIANYKRRYYGVMTTESMKMMIVEFLHPDNVSFKEKWQDSTWIPKEKNYKFFSVHFYPSDNENMMFCMQFDRYE